jgi:hypothetical protein
MKVTKAKCGASVPAANGGYMKVFVPEENEPHSRDTTNIHPRMLMVMLSVSAKATSPD